jgi:hypothetical protein
MILTPIEFRSKTPISKDFPIGEVCPLIDINEFSWFESCDLGAKMYDALLEDLNPIPENVKEWSMAKTYGVDDYVTFYGTVLRSSISNNKCDITCDNLDGVNWEIVPKFKSECVNTLWNRYISVALSYYILSEHLTEITYKISGKGSTKYSDEFRQNTTGLVTIERGERYDLHASIQRNANKFYDVMVRAIKASNCEVAKLATFAKECGDEQCGPKNINKRIAFRK